MFIELTEFLRCPQDHPEVHCVLATGLMHGRDVVHGTLGCPACQREYVIRHGIVRFGDPAADAAPPPALPDAAAVQALLGLASAGGFVALVGSSASLANQLGALATGIHFVAVNPPADMRANVSLSILLSDRVIPLRTSVLRGVVVGAEYVRDEWLADAARVVLPGLRVLVLREHAVPGLEPLASGSGMWVGQKATMVSTTRGA